MKTYARHDKGHNGIIAEYACALKVHREFSDSKTNVTKSAFESKLRELAFDKEKEKQAISHGEFLADFLINSLRSKSDDIFEGMTKGDRVLGVYHCGTSEMGKSSADIEVIFGDQKRTLGQKFSLKVSNTGSHSRGSKMARATLVKFFTSKERLSDEEFVSIFNGGGRAFLEHLGQFKRECKNYYKSNEWELAKINNPDLCSKGTTGTNSFRFDGAGDYFTARTGVKSEYRFAELIADMINLGFLGSAGWSSEKHGSFIRSFKFFIGADDSVKTLLVNKGVVEVVSDFDKFKNVLRPGFKACAVSNKSVVSVSFTNGCHSASISFNVWQDSTIQYQGRS